MAVDLLCCEIDLFCVFVEDEALVEWINPMYLDTGVVKDIRARFEEESEIQLQEFLLVNFCSVTALELTSKQAPVKLPS